MTGSATKQSMPLRHCERSEAIHLAAQRKTGLLRRCAPLRKRFAFVAGNDGGARASRHCEPTGRAPMTAPRRSNPCLSVIASAAKQSISLRKEKLDCFVAALPYANASRLSQAMTEERALPVIASQRVARMRADGLREAIQASPSLRAQRSNPSRRAKKDWIASSLRSLAQTLRVCRR